MITIVNYGMGNLGSVLNMFKKVGIKAHVTSDLNEISKAEKLLLPGVGAFDAAMQRINDAGMIDVLKNKALVEKIPVLGICLGMQLLTQKSEEGIMPGLGWIPAETVKFIFEKSLSLKVPHMGWNTIFSKKSSLLTNDFANDSRFYFVHSYIVKCQNDENVICTTDYGVEFASIIQSDNIYGAQFHPEKSHKFGMQLFKNFSKI
jgi:glutamine amidotransferase